MSVNWLPKRVERPHNAIVGLVNALLLELGAVLLIAALWWVCGRMFVSQ